MQPLNITERTGYASLSARFVAVVIDTVLIGLLFVAVLIAAEILGFINLASYRGKDPFAVSVPLWSYAALYVLLFVYYTVFELGRAATPGKSWLGMRVTAVDGGPAPAGAVLVRNLVRIPEAFFYYIPSAVACLATAKRQRLGDLAAHTVVVRRVAVVAVPPQAVAPPYQGPAPVAAAPTAATLFDDALDGLQTAALGVRGAHHNYLRLSEREIERGGGVTAEFSPEYTAAWHTLADAVISLQHANADAETAARQAGVSRPDAVASRPDLAYLCRELEPYFSAVSDDQVQDAYLTVARQEAAAR